MSQVGPRLNSFNSRTRPAVATGQRQNNHIVSTGGGSTSTALATSQARSLFALNAGNSQAIEATLIPFDSEPSLALARVKDEMKDGIMSKETSNKLLNSSLQDLKDWKTRDLAAQANSDQKLKEYNDRRSEMDSEMFAMLKELSSAIRNEEPGANAKLTNFEIYEKLYNRVSDRLYENIKREFEVIDLNRVNDVNYASFVQEKQKIYINALEFLEKQLGIVFSTQDKALKNQLLVRGQMLAEAEAAFGRAEKTYELLLKGVKLDASIKSATLAEKNKHKQELAKIEADIRAEEAKGRIELEKISAEVTNARIKANAEVAIATRKAEADEVDYQNRSNGGCLIC